ncbi:MAG: carboxyl transferase [Lachnospiraceae bacterium]|nr:carboxyl transferase [Lachnospiraceae bacterium]
MSNLTNSSAGQRILSLLDENSFVEIGSDVRARSTDFNAKPKDAPGDGVITGYGTVDGRLVYVYSQDPKSLGGSIGEMHAKKIVNIYRLAVKTGYPVVGILDSTGLRISESTDALNSLGSIMRVMAKASGVIPQITAVFGNAGGGMSVVTELSDFVFMEEKGKLFLNSPNAVKGNYEEKCDTSSAEYKAEAGAVDVAAPEAELFAKIRDLLSYLPDNCDDEAVYSESEDDLNRVSPDLASLSKDSYQALLRIADDGRFFELKAESGKNLITGFIRLNGATIGVAANRSEDITDKDVSLKNHLSLKGMRKALKLIDFCDAFNIPILTLTNVNGFCTCEKSEKLGSRVAAKLIRAFAGATVPKVNVVTGEAYGTAAIVMNSKAVGADYVYAWNSARIGAMDGRHAAEILFEGEADSVISEKAKEYDELQGSSASAAARGYVDTVIDPQDTRKYVIGAFEMLYGKRVDSPDRKHSTI